MRGHGRFYGCAASEVEFRCSGRKIVRRAGNSRYLHSSCLGEMCIEVGYISVRLKMTSVRHVDARKTRRAL